MITLSNFSIRNKTNRTLIHVKLFCRANAGVSVYEVTELKPQEILPMEIKIETLPPDGLFTPVFFGH